MFPVGSFELQGTASCGTAESGVCDSNLDLIDGGLAFSSSGPSTPSTDQNCSATQSPVLHVLDTAPYPHCPIFIPSKARYELERGTVVNLIRELIPFTLVVEVEDAEQYNYMIDQLVHRFYGASGMVHTSAPDVPSSTPVNFTDAACDAASLFMKQATPTMLTNSFRYGIGEECVTGSIHLVGVTKGKSTPDMQNAERRCQGRVAHVYHRGYTFLPITSDAGGDAALRSGDTHQTSCAQVNREEGTNIGCEDAQSAPWLHTAQTVEAVRRLFQVRVLPESGKGVGYVRNYILHVLVPEVMVGSGVDVYGHLRELSMFSTGECKLLNDNALRAMQLDPSFYATLEQSKRVSVACATDPPHGLYGFYWVFDDDIYSFFCTDETTKRNVRLSVREMMRQVERRLACLRKNALRVLSPSELLRLTCGVDELDLQPKNASHEQDKMPIFTCREDALANNTVQPASLASDKPRTLTLQNYPYYMRTACYALEYARFAYNYGGDALAVNSYNTIACLFNYHMMHSPTHETYFPRGVTAGLRLASEVLSYYGDNRPWYRFTVREDYDMTLQLIARGYCTVRFRNIGFEVPQMAKLRGGMTSYYKNCSEHMQGENERFIRAWPSISQHWVKGKNSTERDDIRVRWDLLHPLRTRHPGALLYLRDPLLPPQTQRRVRDEFEGVTSREVTTNQSATTLTRPNYIVQNRVQQNQTLLKSNGSFAANQVQVKNTDVVALENTSLPTNAKNRTRVLMDRTMQVTSGASENVSRQPHIKQDEHNQQRENEKIEIGSHSSTTDSNTSSRASNWRGYTVEQWRDIQPEEATQLGLQLIPNNELRVGQTVAVIPPLFSQNPSVVLATLIDKTTDTTAPRNKRKANDTSSEQKNDRDDKNIEWTAVVQGVRGMPLLSVTQCYAPPSEGTERAAAAVDLFFSSVNKMHQ